MTRRLGTSQRKAQVCLVWWVEVEVGGNEKKEGNEEGEKRLCNVQYMSFKYILIHLCIFFFFFWTDDGNVLQERMGSRTRWWQFEGDEEGHAMVSSSGEISLGGADILSLAFIMGTFVWKGTLLSFVTAKEVNFEWMTEIWYIFLRFYFRFFVVFCDGNPFL